MYVMINSVLEISEPPQGDVVLDDANTVKKIKQDTQRSTGTAILGLNSTVVCCFPNLYTIPS